MLSLTRPGRAIVLLGAPALTSVLACGGGPQGREQIVRRGGDVLASVQNARLADSVPGDAILAGGELTFAGATGGDYLGAGGNQVIGGRIHGSVRAAGGEVRVRAAVDRNVTIAGGSLVLDTVSVVGRNAYLVGGTVRLAGTVRDGVQISGGTVILDGVVGGDVEVNAGEFRVGPRAQIGGGLRYRVPAKSVRIDRGARIAGSVVALPVPNTRGFWRVLGLLWALGFLITGLAVVALAPRLATRAAIAARAHPGLSVVMGVAWVVLVPIAIVLVAATLVGMPLALVTAAVYGVLLYLGRVAVAVWLGALVLRGRVGPNREGALLSFLIGGAILALAGLIPGLGTLVTMIATAIGLGALLLELRAALRGDAGAGASGASGAGAR